MRLINTTTRSFEEFIGQNIPKYAILSHTWEEEEVSFADVVSNPRFRKKKGWAKIAKTCEIAALEGHRYAWVDTCCIDKSSSAELTEAINSMYTWYRNAEVCYVFLSDLTASASAPRDTTTDRARDKTKGKSKEIAKNKTLDKSLGRCRWFSRGWTLQELIAPFHVVLYNQDWTCIGTKNDLSHLLHKITRISIAVLTHQVPLSEISVAQKMSWAAFRETTRIEDTAYCLLGIFDVNMPLLYGEGKKAFRRLQEEIIKSTLDLSILAWKLPSQTALPLGLKDVPLSEDDMVCGLLADSPEWFAECVTIRTARRGEIREFSLTHTGIKIQSLLRYEELVVDKKNTYGYVLDLRCMTTGEPATYVGIRLKKCGFDQFLRVNPWKYSVPKRGWFSEAYRTSASLVSSVAPVRYLLTEPSWTDLTTRHDARSIATFAMETFRLCVVRVKYPDWAKFWDIWPAGGFDLQDEVFFSSYGDHEVTAAIVRLRGHVAPPGHRGHKKRFDIVFFVADWRPGREIQCSIVNFESHPDELTTIRSELPAIGYNSHEFKNLLRFYGIPKTSKALVRFPDSSILAVVSFTKKAVTDPKVCKGEFWSIEFHCDMVSEGDAPRVLVDEGEWRMR